MNSRSVGVWVAIVVTIVLAALAILVASRASAVGHVGPPPGRVIAEDAVALFSNDKVKAHLGFVRQVSRAEAYQALLGQEPPELAGPADELVWVVMVKSPLVNSLAAGFGNSGSPKNFAVQILGEDGDTQFMGLYSGADHGEIISNMVSRVNALPDRSQKEK